MNKLELINRYIQILEKKIKIEKNKLELKRLYRERDGLQKNTR